MSSVVLKIYNIQLFYATAYWKNYIFIDNATLNRFFSLHYLLPFGIAAAVLIHIAELHREGSTNPLGICNKDIDKVSFWKRLYDVDMDNKESIKSILGSLTYNIKLFQPL